MTEKILLLNHQRKIRLKQECLERGITFIEKHIPENLRKINVVLVSDRMIRNLNKKFLNKNNPTDVLTFNLGSKAEIIISVETAKRQALDTFHSTECEILYLIIHGILHLSGFNDSRYSDYSKMKKQQDRIFSITMRMLGAERKKTGYC